jgi:hypothetical protein
MRGRVPLLGTALLLACHCDSSRAVRACPELLEASEGASEHCLPAACVHACDTNERQPCKCAESAWSPATCGRTLGSKICKCDPSANVSAALSWIEDVESGRDTSSQLHLHERSASERFMMLKLAVGSAAPTAATALAAARACEGASTTDLRSLQERLAQNHFCAVGRSGALKKVATQLLSDSVLNLPATAMSVAAQRRAAYVAVGNVSTTMEDILQVYRSLCVPLLHAVINCGGPHGETDATTAAALALWLQAPEVLERIVDVGMPLARGAIPSHLAANELIAPGRGLAHLAALVENSADGTLALFASRTPELYSHRDVWGLSAAELVHPGGDAARSGSFEESSEECSAAQSATTTPVAAGPDTSPGVEHDADHGSWPTAEVAPAGFGDVSACAIDEIRAEAVYANASTMAAFVRSYVLGRRPVMVRGASTKDVRLQELRQLLSRGALLQAVGGYGVTIADIPYGKVFGRNQSESTIAEFVRGFIDRLDADAAVVADRVNCSAADTSCSAKELPADLPPAHVFVMSLRHPNKLDRKGQPKLISLGDLLPHDPDWVSAGKAGQLDLDGKGSATRLILEGTDKMGARQFYLGGPHTGAPMHWHNAAWNYLAYGLKVWALMPQQPLYSNLPVRSLFANRFEVLGRLPEPRPPLPPLVCTQSAGDLLVVPSRWAHATYNLRTSIGLAVEFSAISATSEAK